MGLRRKRKVESELVELFDLVRAELETMRTEIHDDMAETASVLSTRVSTEIEQRMGDPSALVSGIREVHEIIAGRDTELVHVLQQVGTMCEALADQVQSERIERTTLADAIKRLTNSLVVGGTLALPPPTSATPAPTSTPASRETVIGGTVDPARTEEVESDPAMVEVDLDAVDLVAETDVSPASRRPLHPDGVEVRCRFGDRWVTGFEVCEVIRLDDVTRYRLRRRSDGSVIPTLFEEKDLRFFTTTYSEFT